MEDHKDEVQWVYIATDDVGRSEHRQCGRQPESDEPKLGTLRDRRISYHTEQFCQRLGQHHTAGQD